MTQFAHDFLVVATGLLIFCGIAGWMLTRPVSVAPEWPAPVRVQLVAKWPIAEWEAGIAAYESRQSIYEQWMRRRADEAPWFAQLAREMGLGYALGVAA